MNVLSKLRQISLMASVLFMSSQCSGMQVAQSVAQLTNGTVIAIQGPNGKYITYGNGEPLTKEPYSIAGNQPYIPCWTWFSLTGTNPEYPICQFTVEQNSDGSFMLTSGATDEPLQAIPGPVSVTNPATVLASGVANLSANAENWNITILGGQATLRNQSTGFLLNPTGTLLRATGSAGTSFTIQIISSASAKAVTQVAPVAGATAGLKKTAPVTTGKVKGQKGKRASTGTVTSATRASVTSGKTNGKKGKTSASTSARTGATSSRSGGKKGALAKQMAGTTP